MIVNILNYNNTPKKMFPNFCQITPTSYLNKEQWTAPIQVYYSTHVERTVFTISHRTTYSSMDVLI